MRFRARMSGEDPGQVNQVLERIFTKGSATEPNVLALPEYPEYDRAMTYSENIKMPVSFKNDEPTR